MKEDKDPHCESCGALTKELFEQRTKWLCKKCSNLKGYPRGRVVKKRPPVSVERGKILKAKTPTFSQTGGPDSDFGKV